ncbi:MAG TPA: ABC-2 family transporter protein [Myxococcota bacterium]|nr:ABC-2 family transporter protein [Myxococcota bacterium]
MRLRAVLRFARTLVATNLRASLALRGAFWLQAVLMVVNNVAFFTMWWILFARFREIGGWRLQDMMTLFGIVAPGFGLAVVFGGGARQLARAIVDGQLDSRLTQPKPVLLHAVASQSTASGWGDVLTGAGMLYLAGRLDLAHAPFIALAIAVSALTFVASAVIFQSLAFWLGDVEQLARQLWEFTLNFALYPQPLFAGSLSFILYTLLPAGFVGFLPVEIVRSPSLHACLYALGGAVLWWTLAIAVFTAGLRRYESGNRFGATGS